MSQPSKPKRIVCPDCHGNSKDYDYAVVCVNNHEALIDALQVAQRWLRNGIPQPPHQGSHTPESGCDMNCSDLAQFETDMGTIAAILALARAVGREG